MLLRALALLLWLFSAIAPAAELREKHVPSVLISNMPAGQIKIYFSKTQEARIKVMSITLVGPPTPAEQYGNVFLWRDLEHTALSLPIGANLPRTIERNLGADWITIPPGGYLCLFAWAAGDSPLGVMADIFYVLEP